MGHFGIGHGDAVDLGENWTSTDTSDGEAGLGLIEERLGSVIGDIEVEKSVAIDIGQGHGGAARLTLESALEAFGKMTVAIVEKEARSPAQGIDQQVQIAIAIDIRQNSAGGNLSSTGNSGGCSHVLKLPVTQVSVEDIGA